MTAINFANALGQHPDYLEYRTARAEVLASNIANADTPGYKARDLQFSAPTDASSSFQQALELAQSRWAGEPAGTRSNARHFDIGVDRSLGQPAEARFEMVYRTPGQQPGLDGNSVDVQRESMEVAKNALDFSVSFRLMNSKFSGLSKAIKGE